MKSNKKTDKIKIKTFNDFRINGDLSTGTNAQSNQNNPVQAPFSNSTDYVPPGMRYDNSENLPKPEKRPRPSSTPYPTPSISSSTRTNTNTNTNTITITNSTDQTSATGAQASGSGPATIPSQVWPDKVWSIPIQSKEPPQKREQRIYSDQALANYHGKAGGYDQEKYAEMYQEPNPKDGMHLDQERDPAYRYYLNYSTKKDKKRSQRKYRNYYRNWSKYKEESEKKPELLEYFGIFPDIPNINLLKFFSILTLLGLVEINILLNLNADKVLGENLASKPEILIGVGIIGIFLAVLYRYIKFELASMMWQRYKFGRTEIKTYLTLFFMGILFVFVIVEIIIELLFTRGFLFAIDLMSIMSMIYGTYTILSGKRSMNIITFVFIFMIMLIGSDYQPNLPLLAFIGTLTIIYLELSDGACRMQECALRFKELTKNMDYNMKLKVADFLNDLTVKFVKTLGIFIILTVAVSGILLAIYLSYPYILPDFMGENLELQSIYAMLPIFLLLFLVFIITYLLSSNRTIPFEQKTKSKLYD